MVERENDGGGAVAYTELGKDVSDVTLHGRFAEVELGGDLVVGGPTPDTAKDVELPCGQQGDGGRVVRQRRRCRSVDVEHSSGDGGIEPGVTRSDCTRGATMSSPGASLS